MNKKYIYIILAILVFSCQNNKELDDNDNIESYRMASQIINFYVQIEYIKLEPYQKEYPIDFKRYEDIIELSNNLREVILKIDENIPSSINKETKLFIEKGISLSNNDEDVVKMIKELNLNELANKVDNEVSFKVRQKNAYKLLLNCSVVTQLMIDRCTSRNVLIYPTR